jgi:hypothetical protein
MPGRGGSPPLRALLVAAVAALPPLVGGGCAPGPPFGGAADAAVSDAGAAALAERLPTMVAGFRRGATRPAIPGGGREVGYSTEVGRATAAATVEVLADGTPPGPALDALLADVLRAGPAREMREAGRFTVPALRAADAVSPLLCAETAGRYGRERVAGLACAGRAGGALVRIRVTMPAREPPPADPRAFAEAVAAAMSGGAVVAAAAPAG